MRKTLAVGIFVFVFSHMVFAAELNQCMQIFKDTEECPLEMCVADCLDILPGEPCYPICKPKACVDIHPDLCPEDRCHVITTCSKERICQPKKPSDNPACGDLSYAGNVECCEGLVKRCGIEFFDGTCDMTGKGSMYAMPICVPCGNGVCNQFENRCNCPEDCGPSNDSKTRKSPKIPWK